MLNSRKPQIAINKKNVLAHEALAIAKFEDGQMHACNLTPTSGEVVSMF